jgi:hypothetical protein
MIHPISQEQFKKFFTQTKGSQGSLTSRIQRQCVETRWYRDDQSLRAGVIIYDARDEDWQAILLKEGGLGGIAPEVRVSLFSEKEAIEVLLELFRCETEETNQLLERINRLSVANTGRTGAELLLETPPEMG